MKTGWGYFGDGVYARFDGFHVLLRKNSHENEDSEIALEWSVFIALVRFGAKCFETSIEVAANE
jgi:hypothetical protein